VFACLCFSWRQKGFSSSFSPSLLSSRHLWQSREDSTSPTLFSPLSLFSFFLCAFLLPSVSLSVFLALQLPFFAFPLTSLVRSSVVCPPTSWQGHRGGERKANGAICRPRKRKQNTQARQQKTSKRSVPRCKTTASFPPALPASLTFLAPHSSSLVSSNSHLSLHGEGNKGGEAKSSFLVSSSLFLGFLRTASFDHPSSFFLCFFLSFFSVLLTPLLPTNRLAAGKESTFHPHFPPPPLLLSQPLSHLLVHSLNAFHLPNHP